MAKLNLSLDSIQTEIGRVRASESEWRETLCGVLLRRRYLAAVMALGGGLLAIWPGLGIGVLLSAIVVDAWRERVLAHSRYKEQLLKLVSVFSNRQQGAKTWYLEQDLLADGKGHVPTSHEAWRRGLPEVYAGGTAIRLVTPMAYVHKLRLTALIARLGITGQYVIDLGCHYGVATACFLGGWRSEGVPQDRRYRPAVIANRVVAADLMHSYARTVAHGLQAPAVQADVAAVPMRSTVFACVSMCEILEHLDRPSTALLEASCLLRPNGWLILTTPNRHGLHADHWLNPLLFLLRLLSLTGWEAVLPPPQLTYEDEGKPAYHTNFSRSELVGLLEQAGFTVEYLGTFAFFTGAHRWVGRLLPRLTLDRYARALHRLEGLLDRVPGIRYLGTHWVVVARKGPPGRIKKGRGA